MAEVREEAMQKIEITEGKSAVATPDGKSRMNKKTRVPKGGATLKNCRIF